MLRLPWLLIPAIFFFGISFNAFFGHTYLFVPIAAWLGLNYGRQGIEAAAIGGIPYLVDTIFTFVQITGGFDLYIVGLFVSYLLSEKYYYQKPLSKFSIIEKYWPILLPLFAIKIIFSPLDLGVISLRLEIGGYAFCWLLALLCGITGIRFRSLFAYSFFLVILGSWFSYPNALFGNESLQIRFNLYNGVDLVYLSIFYFYGKVLLSDKDDFEKFQKYSAVWIGILPIIIFFEVGVPYEYLDEQKSLIFGGSMSIAVASGLYIGTVFSDRISILYIGSCAIFCFLEFSIFELIPYDFFEFVMFELGDEKASDNLSRLFAVVVFSIMGMEIKTFMQKRKHQT